MTIHDIPLDKIDAVIFDLDGTLYDKTRLHRLMIYGQLNHLMLMARQQMERKRIRGRYFGSEPAFYKAYFGMMAHKQTFSPSYVRHWYFHSFIHNHLISDIFWITHASKIYFLVIVQ